MHELIIIVLKLNLGVQSWLGLIDPNQAFNEQINKK